MDEFLSMKEGSGDRLGTIISSDDRAILHKHIVDLVL